MIIDRFAFSFKGGRERNEDCALAVSDGDRGVFIVADGLGGHKDGDVASHTVAGFLADAWKKANDCPVSRQWIEDSVRRANENLLSAQKERKSNMRSTLAMLLIEGQQSAWANVGDTRVYYIRNGELSRITEDHSMAFLKFKSGDILRRDIVSDVDQSRLLRSLGDEDRNTPDIYVNMRPLQSGDAFMLCSDGLWEYLNDDEVMVEYLKSDTARSWSERLLHCVIGRVHPGNDNLSILTVMLN